MNKSLYILVPKSTPRLVYTLNWIFKERWSIGFEIITDSSSAPKDAFVIGYGMPGHYNVPDAGLLWSNDIVEQALRQSIWKGLPTFFSAASSQNYDLSFDLFSAVFYLIARYEEYLPFTPDRHNRFPATASVLYREQLLERPIVDEWLAAWCQELLQLGVDIPEQEFSFQASFDIDMAWSFLHKGWLRNLGACTRGIVGAQWQEALTRAKVLLGKQKDPFDSFDFIQQCHAQDPIRPLFFILAAERNGPFDKHILPSIVPMQDLIKQLNAWAELGIHPSYRCTETPELLEREKAILEQVIKETIHKSRQHYIKQILPHTYRQLIAQGISDDYSMGYGAHLGFRAGTGAAFHWYDLPEEKATKLKVHPFCFMDTTAHFELQLDAATAFLRLKKMLQLLMDSQSSFSYIMHNFSLGTAQEWQGWSDAYADFVQYLNRVNN